MTNEHSDHNIWTSLTYDDPLAARTWLSGLGFLEGTLVLDEDARTVHHSEMIWPEGGRVMVSSRGDGGGGDFGVQRGSAAVYVVTDHPDEIYTRAKGLGADIVRDMADTDYGSRGFSIKDSEGNRWSFGTYAGSSDSSDAENGTATDESTNAGD